MKLTPELRDKFLSFRAAYVLSEQRMVEEEVQAALISRRTWNESLIAVPLTADELKLYKKLFAMHSVNGGELFTDDD